MKNNHCIHVLHDQWDDYELLDSGNRKKLERFGQFIVVRGEPKAWWQPEFPPEEWDRAVAFHTGEEYGSWNFQTKLPREWLFHFDELTLQGRFATASKHIGVFPEKVAHWRWMRSKLANAGRRDLQVLNMFAYTGIASLVAAAAGCAVTHVDAAKGVVNWARENQRLSGLENAPIRWIIDDALKFVKREARRQKRYDVIMLDPPSFGRGPKGEVWKLEEHLAELLAACREVLSEQPLFVLMTMYALEQSALLVGNLLQDMTRGLGGRIQVGELAIQQRASEKMLSLSIFGCWEKEM